MIEAALVATRWLLFSAVMVLFGSSLFLRYGRPPGLSGGDERWSRRMVLIAAAIALLASILSLLAQTAALSGEGADAVRWPVLVAVVSSTHFGLIGALRTALLALLVIGLLWGTAAPRVRHTPVVVGAVLAASFAWTGHGAMNDSWAGFIHLGADVLHLLAAGAWVGALVPLSGLVLRARRGDAIQEAFVLHAGLERFSGVGPAIVALLIITGLVNSWFLIGPAHWRQLFISGYGLTLCAKLLLFVLMLLLAAANRLRWSPRLGTALGVGATSIDSTIPAQRMVRNEPGSDAPSGGSDDDGALERSLQRLRFSLLAETVLALLVMAAVALLGTLQPPVSL